jgi:aspartate 1-decarboxylase
VIDVAANDVLWVRSSPNAKARKVALLPPTNCERTETYAYATGARKSGWIAVQTAAGKNGWINARFVIPYAAWDAS